MRRAGFEPAKALSHKLLPELANISVHPPEACSFGHSDIPAQATKGLMEDLNLVVRRKKMRMPGFEPGKGLTQQVSSSHRLRSAHLGAKLA